MCMIPQPDNEENVSTPDTALVIDGPIDTPFVRQRILELVAARPAECLQAGPFDDVQALALRKILEASLPVGVWQLDAVVEPARWIVYMGKFPDAQAVAPDREFDRKWALTLLNRALLQLAAEHVDGDKTAQFEVLKPFLTGDTEAVSQAEAASQMGMTEGAVKVAIHRLRKRFRELIKREIQQTLTDQSETADELSVLLHALGG